MYLHKRKKSKVNSCHFLRISVDYAQAWECCKYLLSWLPCILLAVGSFLFSCLPHQWSIVNHQICSTVATGLLLRPKSLPGSIGDNKLQTSFFFPFFFCGEALTCIWTLPCAPCIYGISHNSTNEICSGIGISLRFHECCIRDRSTVVCSCPLQLRSCYTHVPWSREFCFERLDRSSLVRILWKLVLSGEASWRCLRRA